MGQPKGPQKSERLQETSLKTTTWAALRAVYVLARQPGLPPDCLPGGRRRQQPSTSFSKPCSLQLRAALAPGRSWQPRAALGCLCPPSPRVRPVELFWALFCLLGHRNVEVSPSKLLPRTSSCSKHEARILLDARTRRSSRLEMKIKTSIEFSGTSSCAYSSCI